eukprot:s644_g31.t1
MQQWPPFAPAHLNYGRQPHLLHGSQDILFRKHSRRSWRRDSDVLRTVLRASAVAAGLRLIIAEKPKVAQQIASAVGVKKVGSHFEGKNMIITSACGHLLEFKDLPWNVALPVFPHFELQVSKGKEKMVKEIKQLASRADILVNACDAGREGELIFRRIQEWLQWKKMPVERLWLQSLTGDAIRSAVQNARPGCDYDNLADAADCRARWDWLIGINGTGSLRKGKWLDKGCSVGRVMSPTLLLVVDREEEIENFQPKPYQDVRATFCSKDGTSYEGKYSTLKQKEQHDWHQIAKEWKPGLEAEVLEDSLVEVTEKPKPLMNLADLQRQCSRLFRMTPSETLASAQKLYEAEKITYPRTDSRSLPNDYKDEVREMLQAQAGRPNSLIGKEFLLCASERVSEVGKKIFDDQKVTDHFAIVPTRKGLEQASARTRDDKVLGLIIRHCVAAFLPDAKFKKLQRKTLVNGYTFTTNEKILVHAGFLALEKGSDVPVHEVQRLRKGTKVSFKEMQVEDKETTPPSRYTQASLLTAMETCGKDVSEAELQSVMGAGIGTSATRASTIDKLLRQEWIASTGAVLRPCVKARNFKQRLLTLGLMDNFSVELTGQWELQLRQIEEGKMKKDNGNHEMRVAVESLVTKATASQMTQPKAPAWKAWELSKAAPKTRPSSAEPEEEPVKVVPKEKTTKSTKATRTTKAPKTPKTKEKSKATTKSAKAIATKKGSRLKVGTKKEEAKKTPRKPQGRQLKVACAYKS